MLEHVEAVHVVGVVGDAQQFSLLKAGDAALFFHLTQCGDGNVFPIFLFPFREVPQTVAVYEQVFSCCVLYQSASGVYWGEGAAQVGKGFLQFAGKSGYAQQFDVFVPVK